MIAGLTGEFWI